jgi:hypothetical protein
MLHLCDNLSAQQVAVGAGSVRWHGSTVHLQAQSGIGG